MERDEAANELRTLRGITRPLRVFNSEPAKLAVARIPNLADRFLLVDDDYFAIPQRTSTRCAGVPCLSTRMFFDAAQLQAWRCNSSSDVLMLPRQAFDLPPGLLPLLSQLDAPFREELRRNDKRLSAEQLTASVTNLDLVDLDNTISFDPPPQAAVDRRQLRVAELNAGRGRHWCEIAAQVLRSPDLRAVDVWFLNEFDLGMARSEQLHTLRLLVYALGLNYAWGAEFVELTNGNAAEQQRTRGRKNRYGLHGNGLLSRWPLGNAAIVRMPGMDALYHHNRSRPRDTAGGYEKRLGGRMSLFATAGVEGTEVLLIATHAQTSWEMDTAHTGAASQLVRTHIAHLDTIAAARGADPPLILLGGDTWPQTCEWVGLTGLVTDKGRTNWVNPRTSKVTFGARGLDDYICGREFRRTSEPVRTVTVGCLAHTQACEFQFALSDHIFVTVNVTSEQCIQNRVCDLTVTLRRHAG